MSRELILIPKPQNEEILKRQITEKEKEKHDDMKEDISDIQNSDLKQYDEST